MRYARAADSFDYRMPIPLYLIAPGLLRQPNEALAGMRSMAALAAFATAPLVEENGLEAAVLRILCNRSDMPIAPIMALGADVDIGADYILAADPVHLIADRADVGLAQRVDDLAVDEASALADMLNAHFAADGLRFVTTRPDAWFARLPRAIDAATTPVDAVRGHGIYPFLPHGHDAVTLRGWQNEIQMLLHEHPVNAAREARNAIAVTGFWLWGGGAREQLGDAPVIDVVAAADRPADLLHGLARLGGGTFESLAIGETLRRIVDTRTRTSDVALVAALPAIGDVAALRAFDMQWLGPALELLSGHTIASLHVVADGNDGAAAWHASAPSWWQRLTRGRRAPPFVAPSAT